MADPGLTLYRLATRLGAPLARPLAHHRLGRGKEVAERIQERFGTATVQRPEGSLVWFHAASVGEVNSILPLVQVVRAHKPHLAVLLTTTTATSAMLVRERRLDGVIHQFVPYDIPGGIGRFLDSWRPDAAFFVESEIWPNTIMALNARGVPMLLINARMSERSARRWRLAAPSIRALLRQFSLILAQSESDADRLAGLGAQRPLVTGNLKFDVPAPPADTAMLKALKAGLRGRGVLTAASTHHGEEEAIATAQARIARESPEHLTVIVPRHPRRGAAIAALLRAAGHACQLRSEQERPDASVGIYVADTLGELGLWYRLADSVFMGGSLVRHGGQNPIEAAKLERPLLHGPHVGNFADIYRELDAVGGARQILHAEALAGTVVELSRSREQGRAMTRQALACVSAMGGALERTFAALDAYLPEPAR